MEITIVEFRAICLAASELGAIHALVNTGWLKPYLKKNEAYSLYGRGNVTRWINSGLLTPRKDGNDSACWRIDRLETELIAKANNILLYT